MSKLTMDYLVLKLGENKKAMQAEIDDEVLHPYQKIGRLKTLVLAYGIMLDILEDEMGKNANKPPDLQ